MRWGARSGSGILFVLLAIAIAVATGLIDARGSSARERWQRHGAHSAQAVLSLTVSDSTTGRPIPAGFLGFSFEYPSVEEYAGFDSKAINPVLVQLIRNLTPGQRPVIRIGGDTTDWTWWPVTGVGKPGGIRYSLTPTFARVTAALAHELNARLILGINLEADSATVAATEARELVARIGRASIEGLELGNEPELYASFSWYTTRSGIHVPGRPPGYDFAAYQGDYARISAALPNVPLAGPASGTSNWIANVGAFLAAEPRVRVATVHRYPLQRCYLPAASAMYPSIAHLLSPAASQGLADSVAPEVAAAHARHVALRDRRDELGLVRRRLRREQRLRLRTVGARRRLPDGPGGRRRRQLPHLPGRALRAVQLQAPAPPLARVRRPRVLRAADVRRGRAARLEPAARVGLARQRRRLGDPRPGRRRSASC